MTLQFLTVTPTSGKSPKGLVVCLHGWGANSQDLTSVVPQLNLPDYQFFFPNAPFPHPYSSTGRMWYNLQSRDYQELATSQQQLTEFLKSLEEETGIPLSQTVLSGFSQGGAMTLDVGLSLPLAGLVSLSGYLHGEPASTQATLPPILIAHGRQDQIVPLSAAQRAKEALTAIGASVQYQEYDMGHWIVPEELELVRSFILQALK